MSRCMPYLDIPTAAQTQHFAALQRHVDGYVPRHTTNKIFSLLTVSYAVILFVFGVAQCNHRLEIFDHVSI